MASSWLFCLCVASGWAGARSSFCSAAGVVPLAWCFVKVLLVFGVVWGYVFLLVGNILIPSGAVLLGALDAFYPLQVAFRPGSALFVLPLCCLGVGQVFTSTVNIDSSR